MAGLGLFGVFYRENGIGNRQRKVQRNARHACSRLIRYQLEVVGLATNDAANGDERIVLRTGRQPLQGKRHFQRAGHLHQRHVFGLNAALHQFAQASLGHGVGNVGIEARLHNADAQFFTVELFGNGVVHALVRVFHSGVLSSQ